MELEGRKELVDRGKSSRRWSVPTAGLSLTQKKKKSRPVRGNFKRARGQYMSSPRCSQLFNHESLAPNWSQHITI